jgi:hypothetical protein
MKYNHSWRAYAFTHSELRHLIRTMDEFSLYQGGRWRQQGIHNAAHSEGVKVQCRQHLMEGELTGFAMHRDQFMMVKVIR